MPPALFAGKEIVVFDTEYTAWEGSKKRNWSGPNERREIVQIGAVKIRTDDLAELSDFAVFVKPEKNPILSPYFTALTGITQKKIETDGVGFAEAIKRFAAWAGGLTMYCWGGDAEVMRANADLAGIKFQFAPSSFRDARAVFSEHGVPAENYMSSTIVRAFGKEPKRRGHDALNDARAIVDGFRELSKKSEFCPDA